MLATASGSGTLSASLMRISGAMKSFQAARKANRPTVIRPGFTAGIRTRMRAENVPHPSTSAASSSSLGTASKLIRIMQVANASWTLFQLPFAPFMMRISFEAVPKELEEAALVDGCGTFSALIRVLIPAVKPGLITVGLFAFLAAWNDFIAPLILISDADKVPLPLAVANMRQQVQGIVDYVATQAGGVVLAVPCVRLVLLLQRHYVRGFVCGVPNARHRWTRLRSPRPPRALGPARSPVRAYRVAAACARSASA